MALPIKPVQIHVSVPAGEHLAEADAEKFAWEALEWAAITWSQGTPFGVKREVAGVELMCTIRDVTDHYRIEISRADEQGSGEGGQARPPAGGQQDKGCRARTWWLTPPPGTPGGSQQGKGRRGQGVGAPRPVPDDEKMAESKYHDDRTGKGIAIVIELCSRDDLSMSQLVEMHREAVEQLQQAGPEGQNALARLLPKLLASRSASPVPALVVAGELQPHPDLIQAVREVCAAAPLGVVLKVAGRTLETLTKPKESVTKERSS
jgi:hypothetical protein